MVCNLTCCDKASRAGFSLVEYLVGTMIGVVVLGAGLAFWAFGSKTCASLLAYVELSSKSKNASDLASQQIRNARRVQSCSDTQLVLLDVSGQTNVLTYSAAEQKLFAQRAGAKRVLLEECTNFHFSVYQRTPVSNSMELYTNAFATNTARVVQMQWACKRKITGDKDDVETQLSAKVVIRNP